MTVLVVSYRAEISGGSNRSLLSVLEVMKKRGHKVVLILPKKEGNMYDEAEKLGIECVYIPLSRIGVHKPSRLSQIWAQEIIMRMKLIHDYLSVCVRKRMIRNIKADVIYTNGAIMHGGRFISKITGTPHIWHIREFFEKTELYPKNIYQLMNDGTDAFILISSAMLDIYKRYISPDKLFMISNGIKYIEQPAKTCHSEFNILLTGRITEAKAQIDAVNAIALIKPLERNIKLYFAGKTGNDLDEQYKKKVEELINEKQLQNSVSFLGEVDDMGGLRSKMDIELVCAPNEAFGRVTVEAMRSGLPVIGTEAGGTLDIIKDGYNGFFYKPHDFNKLAEKIIELYHDKSMLDRLSYNAKEFSKTHFTEMQLEKIVDTIENVAKN